MSRRPISTFPLAQNQITALVNAGYTIASDIRKVQPARLAQDLECSLDDAVNILRLCRKTDAENQPNGSTALRNSHSRTSSNNSNSNSSSSSSSSSSTAHSGNVVGSDSKLGTSALDLLKTVRTRSGIVTFSPEIDKQLFSGSGGVPIGQMTEFCGAPGLGKTQICMQLACNVTIPHAMGGVDGSCVYIDTEGSFMVDRVYQIASALESHLKMNCRSRKANMSDIPRVADILSKIHCFRVHDYTEQLATLKMLPEFISTHPDVKLIVLDSVAFHFRHDFTDMAKRSRVLSQMAQMLNKMSSDYNLSVVVTNHVTTRLGGGSSSGSSGSSSGGSGSSSSGGSSSSSSSGGSGRGNNDTTAYLAPALGESWSHAATNRVELFWNQTRRTARLTKSPSLSLRSVPYQIVADGVRGISFRTNNKGKRLEVQSSAGNSDGGGEGEGGNEKASKKQRVL